VTAKLSGISIPLVEKEEIAQRIAIWAIYFLFSMGFENSTKDPMFRRQDPFTGSFLHNTRILHYAVLLL